MGSEKIFKGSLFGYNKKDVLSYIAELSDSSLRRSAELKNEVDRLSAKLAECEKDSGIKNELAAALESLAGKEAQIGRLERELEAARAEAEECRRKADTYDENAAALADVMIKAHEDAGRISADARRSAQAVKTAILSEVESAIKTIDSLGGELDAIKNGVSSRLVGLERELNSAGQKFDDLRLRFKVMREHIELSETDVKL